MTSISFGAVVGTPSRFPALRKSRAIRMLTRPRRPRQALIGCYTRLHSVRIINISGPYLEFALELMSHVRGMAR